MSVYPTRLYRGKKLRKIPTASTASSLKGVFAGISPSAHPLRAMRSMFLPVSRASSFPLCPSSYWLTPKECRRLPRCV
jgi:hypothetical protein